MRYSQTRPHFQYNVVATLLPVRALTATVSADPEVADKQTCWLLATGKHQVLSGYVVTWLEHYEAVVVLVIQN